MGVSERVFRIKALLCAIIAGLILIYSEISMKTGLGITLIQYVQEYYPSLNVVYQVFLSEALDVLITISNYLGMVIIVVGVLIFFGKYMIAKYLFILTIGAGVFGFAIPFFSALIFGGQPIEAVINSIGTKYLVVICLSLITKLYGEHAAIK